MTADTFALHEKRFVKLTPEGDDILFGLFYLQGRKEKKNLIFSKESFPGEGREIFIVRSFHSFDKSISRKTLEKHRY